MVHAVLSIAAVFSQFHRLLTSGTHAAFFVFLFFRLWALSLLPGDF